MQSCLKVNAQAKLYYIKLNTPCYRKYSLKIINTLKDSYESV